ncbi:MAG TPA: ATP-binding cassette domain-containing protein [Vicinamibacterales bacterium]|jgi:putative ATP-binding cassette transporter
MSLQLFVQFLLRHAGPRRRRILISGVASGLFQGLAIVAIGTSLDAIGAGRAPSLLRTLFFVAGVAGFFICYRLAMTACSSTMTEAVLDSQLRIAERLLRVRYREFLKIDESRIYDSLMGDKGIVMDAARSFAMGLSSVAIALCSFAYAAVVSPAAFGTVVATLALCGLIYMWGYRTFLTRTELAEAAQGEFASSLDGLLTGFTELKMNRRKSDDFFDHRVRALHERAAEAKRLTEDQYIVGSVQFSTMIFFPIGAVLFLLPKFTAIGTEVLINLLGITLLTLVPVMGLVLLVPAASKAWLAIDALQRFEGELNSLRDDEEIADPRAPSFETIEIRHGQFAYPDGGGDGFTVHIDGFRLKCGEFAMLTGGNGSGKSTFMRALAGLESLTDGSILVDGRPVSEIGMDNYRCLFSVLFVDFHLFDSLYGLRVPATEVERALERLRLVPAVRFDGRRFSTLNLSSGQRKRLAVVCAELEGRAILLFDEVAADLDHESREYFYRTLLPELKRQGRTLLVISHDDRYFDVADRVLTMRDGRFVDLK